MHGIDSLDYPDLGFAPSRVVGRGPFEIATGRRVEFVFLEPRERVDPRNLLFFVSSLLLSVAVRSSSCYSVALVSRLHRESNRVMYIFCFLWSLLPV